MFWLQRFRKRKLQSAMIYLMVAICALLMAGSLIILSSLDKPYNNLAVETNAPNVKVYPMVNANDSGRDWVSELKKLDCVKDVKEVHRYNSDENLKSNGKTLEVFVSTVVYDKDLYGNERVLDGDMSSLKDGECYIASTFANSQNIGVGDTVTVVYGKKEFSYKVKAIFADVYSLHTSFQMEMLIPYLPEELKDEPYYAVYAEPGKTGEDIVDAYLNSNHGIMDGNFNTLQNSISNAHITENIIGAILMVLSIVIFLVASVMIRYMIKNALLRDTKTIAIYKALGYTDANIRKIYITFYQVIVFAGTITGLLASPLITQAFMRAAFENLGKTEPTSGWLQGFACAAVINLFVFLQVNGELKKVRKMKPAELLSGTAQELGIKKVKEKNRAGSLSFSPFAMAIRMMKRDKKNTALIILTCFLSVYMVNFAIVCFDNMEGMSQDNYYWLGFDKHDVSIENTGDLNRFYEITDELKENKDVKNVVKRNLDVGFCVPYEQSVAATVYEDYDCLNFPVVSGREPENSNEVVIGNYYAKRLGKEIGDYIEVYLNGETKVNLLIVGTCQGFYNMGQVMRMKASLFDEHQVNMEYPQASVMLKDGVDKEEFVRNFNKTYKNESKAIIREDLYANIIGEIIDPQKAALGPFVVLALIIGTLNLIYIIYLKNLNSIRTHSIYKSIGYPVSHLIKMNCFYVGIIAFLSIAVAVPIFIFTFPKTMVLAMSAFGFAEYRVTYRGVSMLVGNMGVLMIFLLGVLVSGRELKKNHIETLVSE